MWYEDAGAAVVCGGREGIEWLRAIASRHSRAGQKVVELPPACGQQFKVPEHLKTQPVSDFARHP